MKKIPLTQGKVAIVDDEDYERLVAHKWYAWHRHVRDDWYARRSIRSGSRVFAVWMHRVILGLPPGGPPETDHSNGDGLDNRRNNLRVATRSQNQANGKIRRNNSSGFRGVWREPAGTWRAVVKVDGKRVHLGCFATREQAVEAYRCGAERHFGEFAFHRRTREKGRRRSAMSLEVRP